MNKSAYIYIVAFGLLLFLCLIYANHFDNGFYFDDGHTITNNENVQSIKLYEFFTDPATFSTLPANQSYRPVTTLMNAIDYQLAGSKYDSFYYHRTIFFFYILQLILTYFLFRGIMNIAWKHEWNTWIALFATAYYGFHTVNAETINYIIARSDGFATLCTIATLLMYQYRPTRRSFLYLLPLIVGIYTKQTGVMTAPLLLLYIAFFEEKITWEELKKFNKTKIGNILKKSLPAIIIAFGLIVVNQLIITETTSINVTVTKFQYFITQLYVTAYYYTAFLVPIHLSADPDFKLITNVLDNRVILGLCVHLLMAYLSFRWFKNMKTRPISFGILWYYIALAPTSSFAPLYQMANDHRLYFPIVGLCLAVTWFIALILLENQGKIKRNPKRKYAIVSVAALIICLYGYGTFKRNIVWGNLEKLWEDVTIKSPNNARGWLNYGHAFLKKGENKKALAAFNHSHGIDPNYNTLHINMAVAKGNLSYPKSEIEQHFKRAVELKPDHISYYYFGKFIIENYKERKEEGFQLVKKAYEISPTNIGIKKYYENLQIEMLSTSEERIEVYLKRVAANPNAQDYILLSHEYYALKKYEKTVQSAQKAVNLDPSKKFAYNNMCIAYCQLNKWKKAVNQCNKALKLDPQFKLAKNNLKWAKDGLAGKYNEK